MKRRAIHCPDPCGAVAERRDTRRMFGTGRLIRARLYVCKGGHQFETAETIVGEILPVQKGKMIINRYTVNRNGSRDEDYRL